LSRHASFPSCCVPQTIHLQNFFWKVCFKTGGGVLGLVGLVCVGVSVPAAPAIPHTRGGGLQIRGIRADVSANCPIMPIMLTNGFNDFNDLADYTPHRLHDAP